MQLRLPQGAVSLCLYKYCWSGGGAVLAFGEEVESM